jgi:hypothetical protein
MQPHDFFTAASQIAEYRQVPGGRGNVKDFQHHGALFLLGQQGREQIAPGCGTTTAN